VYITAAGRQPVRVAARKVLSRTLSRAAAAFTKQKGTTRVARATKRCPKAP